MIETVHNLKLDLRQPPGDHLLALTPCVTGTIDIFKGLTDYSLATLFDNVNCKELHLFTERLDQEETEALVRAMTSRVETLHLSVHIEFHMEYDTFSNYRGDGKCTEMHIMNPPNHHMSSLLDSVNIKELHLFSGSTNLDQKETEALVRAMTSRVEIVHLGGKDGEYKDTISLDFDTLTKYKGNGKCREVHCNHMCIGWRDDDYFDDVDGSFDYEYEDPIEHHERRGRILITSDEGHYVYGLKDKWIDDESAETWADQMNWNLKVENQDGNYLLSRK